MAKEIKKIEVLTLNNGYSLRFDGMEQSRGYLYFSTQELLQGFFLHIGLEMNHQLERKNIGDMMTAAMNWNENEKCVAEIQRLNELVGTLKAKNDVLTNRLIEERNYVINAGNNINTALGNDDNNTTKVISDIAYRMATRKKISAKSLKTEADKENDEEE